MSLINFSTIIVILALVLLVIGSVMKNKTAARVCRSLLCLFTMFAGWVVGMFTIPYFYPLEGIWVVTFGCAVIFLLCLLFIWRPFSAVTRRRAAIVLAAALVIPGAVIFGVTAYHNSIPEITSYEEFPLGDYEPFREGTLAKSLDGGSELVFEDNLPRLDGATALYPLYSAFVRATYPEGPGYDVYNKGSGNSGPVVICSSTPVAFENLINGRVDAIFISGVSDSQRDMAEARGLELRLVPIGSDAFVFFVNKRNAISNLSVGDIRGIYSGRITNWREVGGGNDPIRAYQRSQNSGSQTALEKIMGDTPIMTPLERDVQDLMMGIYKAVADYKNYKNALGYSFLYYITGMIDEDEVKLLSINGVNPNAASIAAGTYPFSNNFYAVTVAREPETDEDMLRMENTQKLIDWIISPQGQSLVEKTGYVPLSEQ